MKALTKKQKVVLKKWFLSGRHKVPYALDWKYDVISVDDLNSSQWVELVNINDTEILFQEANVYLKGLLIEDIRNGN